MENDELGGRDLRPGDFAAHSVSIGDEAIEQAPCGAGRKRWFQVPLGKRDLPGRLIDAVMRKG